MLISLSYPDAKAKGTSLPEDTCVPAGFEFYEYKPRKQQPQNAKNLTATDPPRPLASAGPSRTSESIESPQVLVSSTAGLPAVPSHLSLRPTPRQPGLPILTTARGGPSHVKPGRAPRPAPRPAPIPTSTPTNSLSDRQSSRGVSPDQSEAQDDAHGPSSALRSRPRERIPASTPPPQSDTGSLYVSDSDIDRPNEGVRVAPKAVGREIQRPQYPGRSSSSEHSANSDRLSRQGWHSSHDTESSQHSDTSGGGSTSPPSITALEHFHEHFSRGLFCPEPLHHKHFASHEAFLGKHGQCRMQPARLSARSHRPSTPLEHSNPGSCQQTICVQGKDCVRPWQSVRPDWESQPHHAVGRFQSSHVP